MGIYSEWASKYTEAGYSVLPVNPKTKACYIEEWTNIFSQNIPSDNMMESFISIYKDDDIGIACGKASGVVGIDFDYTGPFAKEIEEKILGALPPSPVAKKGAKGWTRFYKWNESIVNRSFDRLGERMIDVLSTGRLTVAPPSSHRSGDTYKWITEDTLLDIDSNDLPELTLSMISAISDIALIDNSYFHDTKNGKSGRANKIFGFVYRQSNTAKSLDQLIQDTLEFDKVEIGKDPKGSYFSDKKYNGNKSAYDFCKKEVTRYVEYKKKKRLEKGETWSIGSNIDFPSKENGFFKVVPKLNFKNEPILDSNEEPVTKEVIDDFSMANYFKESFKLKTNDSFCYQYKDNYYVNVTKLELKNMIRLLTKTDVTKNQAEQFYETIFTHNFIPVDKFKTKDGFINLKNGVLDVANKNLLPHSHEYYFKYKLSHNYDSSASCPNWINFLNYIFNDDQELVCLMQEIFGYAMVGGDPWLHKAFLFYGEGRNGKSTVIDVLKHLLGHDNCSHVPIQNLNKPFSVVMADGKLANIVGETTGDQIDSESFKMAVGGEDLTAAQKGYPEYPMQFKAKIFFAANKLPTFKDSTAGNYEKLCIIPFDKYIEADKRIPRFAQTRLFNEMSGIINWSLIGLERLMKRQKLPNSSKVDENMDMYRQESDTIYDWITQFVELGVDDEAPRLIGNYYKHYVDFCKSSGKFATSKIGFSRKVCENMRKNGAFFTTSRKGTILMRGAKILIKTLIFE